ncbi:MAG: hypothetical protein K0R38_2244 [Polyangiaceae bacterium]|jgi:hypothetical protein|nr:hypothetical protein [Polyangiaceae bacterium]
MRIPSVCIFISALAACHSGEPAPERQPAVSTPPPRQAPELGPHRSPVSVKLAGPEQVTAGQDIEVVARIDRRVGSDAAVSIALQLPDGARLVSGNPNEVLPSGNGVVERRFVVHLDRVPSTDIQVVAETNSTSFGAHAKSAYRFGRPEPRFAEPPRSGKQVQVGGREVGKPIRLQP